MMYTKKFLAGILALLLCGAAVPADYADISIIAAAEEETADGFVYELTAAGDGIVITGYTGEEAEVIIPAEIGGLPVREIGFNAFGSSGGYGSPLEFCESMTSLYIPDSVTSIGSYAFKDCRNLTSIRFSENLTFINNYAFDRCTSLTHVYLPDSLTILGGYTFANCTNLISVHLPKNLTAIGDSAFATCPDLITINIPDSVTYIGACAFFECSSLTSMDIPDSVTEIGGGVFAECTSLKRVKLSQNIKSLDHGQTGIDLYGEPPERGFFENCINLTDLTIPDAVESIGQLSFNGTDLGEVYMGVRYISDWAVGYEEGTSEINIREGTKGIANGAFSNIMWKSDEINSPITSITIPDSVSIIGNLAFGGCNRLETIVIPDSVTKIGGGVFYGCSGLKEVILPASTYALNYHSITNWDSEDCFGFFEKCTSLTSITIPDGVTSIGWYAFNGCTSLADITIPDSVRNMGMNAFNGTAWYEAQPDGPVYIENWLYQYKGEMPENCAVVISAGTVGIADSAFSGCTGLADITIPDSVTNIGYQAFSGCKSLTDITIPDSVTNIGYRAFSRCTSLTDIIIPDSVTSIESWAFYGCTSLTDITIPDSVTSIEVCAFYGCTSLTNITFPDNVTRIEDYAFEDCSNLSEIILPDSVSSIGAGTFYGCTSLTNITISNPDCEIDDSAGTICSTTEWTGEDMLYSYTGTITGYENSTAQAYAEKYGRTFISLGAAPTPSILRGDADASGEVDAVDASAILVAAAKAAIGEDTGWTDAQKAAADVNGDNVFDSVDASYILQYAAYVGVNGYISMLEFINK